MKTNYHTHTTWCDGRDTPQSVIEVAIAKGFDELGFSSHVDMLKDFDAYVAGIAALKAAYAGRIRILCGLESEFEQGLERRDKLDYVIGSFHFLTAPDGVRFAFDHAPQILMDGIRDHFDGDAVEFVKAYFASERALVALGGFDFLAHPDLVRKFNAKHPFFDEAADWYRGELEATADAIAAAGVPVETNTGAISRGWLDDAYPSPFFRSLLRARGVRFFLNSDAHAADALDCAFDRFGGEEHERLG